MSYLCKRILISLSIIGLLIFSSCHNTSLPIKTIEEIDLLGAYKDKTEVPISSIASEIEYIRLETGKDFMTNDPHIINVKDSLILFIGFRKIYLFSRNTGKFLYEISSYGRGPNEYSSTSSIYDEDEDLFFVSTFKGDTKSDKTYYAYNYHGDIIKTVSIPVLFNLENKDFRISRFWPFNDSLYVGYVENPRESITYKLAIFRQSDDVLMTYPNYNIIEIEETRSFTISLNNGMFFDAEDTVRFFELCTDTIFNVTEQTLIPRYHINMENLMLPYHLRSAQFSEFLNYFHIRNMHESSRFLMFSAGLSGTRHIVCYDKILKRTFVCHDSEDSDFYKFDDFYGLRCIGFSNDLDHFVPIGTDKHFYINKNDEFVTAIPALEVRRWFDNNPEEAARLPEHLQVYRDIKDEDNPIVIVAKLKR